MIQTVHVTFNNLFGWDPGADFCLRVATARAFADRGEINNPGCDCIGLRQGNHPPSTPPRERLDLTPGFQ